MGIRRVSPDPPGIGMILDSDVGYPGSQRLESSHLVRIEYAPGLDIPHAHRNPILRSTFQANPADYLPCS